MTRGGLTIEQKDVDNFIKEFDSPESIADGIDLEPLTGETEILTFSEIMGMAARGITLRLQARERQKSTVKMADLKAELKKRGINVEEVLAAAKKS